MKALLVSKKAIFPKTHDLLLLQTLCEKVGILIAVDIKLINTLSDYAVRIRYPGEDPTIDEARDAVRISDSVRKFARQFFSLE